MLYMKKFFARKQENQFIFEGDELAHFNVLRCKVGENILCLCGEYDYLCEVESVTKKMAVANIVSKSKNTKNPRVNITIFQGLVKGEKADLIVQKLTELGISELQFFESNFTIAKANNNKIDRLNKISAEACKQCGRSQILDIKECITFSKMIDQLKSFDVVFFANEKQTDRDVKQIKEYKNIAIIIGSEGGFSDEEILKIYENGGKNFGLGSRILRAETAAICSASIIGYLAEV